LSGLLHSAMRNGILLGVIAAGGVSLLAGTHLVTRERIAEQEARVLREQLSQVLPAERYDNDPRADWITVQDPVALGQPGPVRIFRARRAGAPVAVVMDLSAPDGYNGDIRLLVGIWYDGSISGVRVIRHRETPGLGDPIEARRSDWITRFTGKSLDDPQARGWAVRKDGGEFDQFTGATITPRAVVAAVQRALAWFAAHRDSIFEQRADA
jgi:electron transport complex protein RnfG